jgi:hypothetical protein
MASWASSGSTTLFIKRVAFATPIVFTFHQVRACARGAAAAAAAAAL